MLVESLSDGLLPLLAPSPNHLREVTISSRRESSPLPLSKRTIVALLVLATILATLGFSDSKDVLRGFLAWIQGIGLVGVPIFVALHAVAIVVLFPGVLFPLGAGFLYGVTLGTLVSVAGKVAGSLFAFLIARHLLDGPVSEERRKRFHQKHPRLERLELELPRGGWRMVLLIRLVPVIPFKISNYFFGWSAFRKRDFVLGTLIGAVPFSFLNAYLGSLGADLAGITERTSPEGALGWAVYVGGAVLAIGAATAIGRRAQVILSEMNTTESAASRPLEDLETPAMKGELNWIQAQRFSGKVDGIEVTLDGEAGDALGPMQAVLGGLAGCMAIDVAHILEKGRQPLEGLSVTFEGRRAESEPRRFVAATLHFEVTGTIDSARIERAIELSRAKYCSVLHSLAPDLELSTSFGVSE